MDTAPRPVCCRVNGAIDKGIYGIWVVVFAHVDQGHKTEQIRSQVCLPGFMEGDAELSLGGFPRTVCKDFLGVWNFQLTIVPVSFGLVQP